MSLSKLPDEMILNIFQFNTGDEIQKTKTLNFTSKFVNECTMFVKMKEAIRANNLSNMKWIKDRYNGSTIWHKGINIGMAIENLGVMKWLYENGVPWTNDTLTYRYQTFDKAAHHGDLDTMKWLYEMGCPWGKYTFHEAVRHGDLENMKWLHEKGCNWGWRIFREAADHGDLDTMKWLYEKGCPWGEHTFREAADHGDLENMKWLHKKGCPWGQETFAWAAYHGDIDNMKWLYKKGCPWGDACIEELRDDYFVKANILQWMQENGCPKFDYDY